MGGTPQLPLKQPKRRLRRVWLTLMITAFILAVTFGSSQFENQVTIINNSTAPMTTDVTVQFVKPDAGEPERTVLLKNRKLSPNEETTLTFHRGQHRLEVSMILNEGDPTREFRMTRRFETANRWGQKYQTSANEQTPRAFANKTPLRRAYDSVRYLLPKSMNLLD